MGNCRGVEHTKPETPGTGETVMGPKEGSAHAGNRSCEALELTQLAVRHKSVVAPDGEIQTSG